jgi:hypothetical protein
MPTYRSPLSQLRRRQPCLSHPLTSLAQPPLQHHDTAATLQEEQLLNYSATPSPSSHVAATSSQERLGDNDPAVRKLTFKEALLSTPLKPQESSASLLEAKDADASLTLTPRPKILSKWFCDTSTGAATGADHYGSFVRGGFCLLVVSSR